MAQSRTEAEAVLLAMSSVLPMTLHAAISLGVFDILAGSDHANLSAEEIVAELPGAKNPDAAGMLDRVLRLLASFGVVSCSAASDGDGNHGRAYGLLPVSRLFAKNEAGVSLGPYMDMFQDPVSLDSWAHLKEAILEGGVPFERAHGAHAFEYTKRHAKVDDVFNKAMFSLSAITTQRLRDAYDGFKHINQLVDVGGGLGVTISMITSKHPSIKGINFDLPHVIEKAPVYPGVEHVGGDMFESVPKGEAIFLKWILHDWSDDLCVKLLRNCYDATPEDGKVIVFEYALSSMPSTNSIDQTSTTYDLIMMTILGGKERTKEEFTDLAIKAGFRGVKLVTQVFNLWVMEFLK